jgi:hypothetical protein
MACGATNQWSIVFGCTTHSQAAAGAQAQMHCTRSAPPLRSMRGGGSWTVLEQHPKPDMCVRRSDLKELKMRPSTDEHDYQVRLRSAIKFLIKVR